MFGEGRDKMHKSTSRSPLRTRRFASTVYLSSLFLFPTSSLCPPPPAQVAELKENLYFPNSLIFLAPDVASILLWQMESHMTRKEELGKKTQCAFRVTCWELGLHGEPSPRGHQAVCGGSDSATEQDQDRTQASLLPAFVPPFMVF